MDANQKSILVLEDEPLIAMAMEDAIREVGHIPLHCETVHDALAAVNSGDVSFAVLDLNIRGQTSEPVALSLRSKSIPFLVCSGTQIQQAAGAFTDVVQLGKPYADSELQAHILRALQLPQSGAGTGGPRAGAFFSPETSARLVDN